MDEIIANTPELVQAIIDAVSTGEPISVAAFARLTGTSEKAVVSAWKTGRLPSVPGGKIPIREGIIALVSCGGLRKGKVPAYLLKADEAAREALGYPPREDDAGTVTDEMLRLKMRYLMTQTALKKLTAEAKQRENEIAKGELVRRVEVELDAAECATNIIGVLSRIPERAAGMCVGCSAEEIAGILRKEIQLAVDAIQASAFTGDWGGLEL